MAIGNTSPIYSGNPLIGIQPSVLTTANTAMDGTGTVVTGITAPVTYGAYITKIIIRPLGTNIATALRIFVNNGSTNATAANNSLIADITAPATTAANNASLAPLEIPLGFAIPGGYKLNYTTGTTVAAGFALTVVAGDLTP